MTQLEKLAEREYPTYPLRSATSSTERFRNECAYEKRSAFKKCAKLAVEFMEWWHDDNDNYASVNDAFEIFLQTKYGSDETQAE